MANCPEHQILRIHQGFASSRADARGTGGTTPSIPAAWPLPVLSRRAHLSPIIRQDLNAMSDQLELAFEDLSWPRETLISYQVESQGHEVWLDVDLPEIEDLPQRVATIAANGRKINIKDKAQKQLRQEYALHIHGIAFRLAGTVLAELPKCTLVVVSGYSQRLDSATGKINDDYIYSIRFARDEFAKLNFDRLDLVNPVDAVKRFEIRRKMTATGIFKAIEPYST